MTVAVYVRLHPAHTHSQSCVRSFLPTCLMTQDCMTFAHPPLWGSSSNVNLSQSSVMKTAKPEPTSFKKHSKSSLQKPECRTQRWASKPLCPVVRVFSHMTLALNLLLNHLPYFFFPAFSLVPFFWPPRLSYVQPQAPQT